MIPLRDSAKSHTFPYVNVILIALNLFIYVHEVLLEPYELNQVYYTFGLIPAEVLNAFYTGSALTPLLANFVTAMFIHGGWLHVLSNMLFLWVFGDNVEDALGHFRFLIFYLACGVAGGLVHTLMLPSSDIPLIGASAAVAGVIAAYLMLHPRVRIWVLVLRFIPIRISAATALGAWIITQLVMVLLPQVGPVAWWAHIGGLAAGAVLVVVLRRSGVPLFDRGIA